MANKSTRAKNLALRKAGEHFHGACCTNKRGTGKKKRSYQAPTLKQHPASGLPPSEMRKMLA